MKRSLNKPNKLYLGRSLFTKLREHLLGKDKEGLDIELNPTFLGLVIEIDEANLEQLVVVHSKQISDHDNLKPTEAHKSLKEILEEESRARLYQTIEKDTNQAPKKDIQDSGYVFDEDVWETYFNSTELSNERPGIWSSVTPNAETVTYDNGASESKTELRFDLIPADEIATIAKVLGQGAAKYGDDNWKGLPTWTHLNHALQHIFAYLANDKSDDHLSHAATRLIFAMWSDKKNK